MRRIIFFILMVLTTMCCSAGNWISYSYRALSKSGGTFRYTVVNDSVYYLVVEFESEGLINSDPPKLKLKTMNDDVISLTGKNMGMSQQQSGGVVINGVIVTSTSNRNIAMYEIAPEQISLFKYGIAKIHINTIPAAHERVFKTDRIGKKLYYQFRKLSETVDEDF